MDSSSGLFRGFSFPGFSVRVFLSLRPWSATAYSPEGLFAATHHIWWAFPYPPPGDASGRRCHCTPIHGPSEDATLPGPET